MADQEFLASFAVELDEAGIARLQSALAENTALADSLMLLRRTWACCRISPAGAL